MARIALSVLTLFGLVLGASGCSWTETYNEFPPHVNHAHHAHEGGHPPELHVNE